MPGERLQGAPSAKGGCHKGVDRLKEQSHVGTEAHRLPR
jgi:hypothetical protein